MTTMYTPRTGGAKVPKRSMLPETLAARVEQRAAERGVSESYYIAAVLEIAESMGVDVQPPQRRTR